MAERLLGFVSRAELLGHRQRRKDRRDLIGRLTPQMRNAFLREDEIHWHADVRWTLKHGPVPEGGRLLQFRLEEVPSQPMVRCAGQADVSDKDNAANGLLR